MKSVKGFRANGMVRLTERLVDEDRTKFVLMIVVKAYGAGIGRGSGPRHFEHRSLYGFSRRRPAEIPELKLRGSMLATLSIL